MCQNIVNDLRQWTLAIIFNPSPFRFIDMKLE